MTASTIVGRHSTEPGAKPTCLYVQDVLKHHDFMLCRVYILVHVFFAVLTVQEFRIRPTNKSVILGQTTILPCEVDNVVGSVQWTLNGFALGKLSKCLNY